MNRIPCQKCNDKYGGSEETTGSQDTGTQEVRGTPEVVGLGH